MHSCSSHHQSITISPCRIDQNNRFKIEFTIIFKSFTFAESSIASHIHSICHVHHTKSNVFVAVVLFANHHLVVAKPIGRDCILLAIYERQFSRAQSNGVIHHFRSYKMHTSSCCEQRIAIHPNRIHNSCILVILYSIMHINLSFTESCILFC